MDEIEVYNGSHSAGQTETQLNFLNEERI